MKQKFLLLDILTVTRTQGTLELLLPSVPVPVPRVANKKSHTDFFKYELLCPDGIIRLFPNLLYE